ncbi:hypothetical protein BD311DRAFT_755166 [Dichomitus squalens]|uniref:Uncharacterized protein n=1 Tax=Dichomitus squalens TaxID=114155 RepID=A0A4Q9MT30_9APHY|nr:hypothetical protein BD311DRAFT_755166 [Dichomitus squalens]
MGSQACRRSTCTGGCRTGWLCPAIVAPRLCTGLPTPRRGLTRLQIRCGCGPCRSAV